MRLVSWMRMGAFVAVAAFCSPAVAQSPVEDAEAMQRALAEYSAEELEQMVDAYVADPASLSPSLPQEVRNAVYEAARLRQAGGE